MNNVPKHVVLFPDGNRRWAKQRRLPTIKGHQEGYRNLIKFCQWCKNRGVKTLTAFGFSTENWKRPTREVNYLMKLLEHNLSKIISKSQNQKHFQKEGIKIRVIGQKERLPESLQKTIERVEDSTKNHSEINLNLAVSYGGRWDILQAFKKIFNEKTPLENITEDLVNNYLTTAELPVPDLIIRAGGEKRLSNFLLWQAAYSELYFSDKLWPDFTERDLEGALEEYALRQRRFGH